MEALKEARELNIQASIKQMRANGAYIGYGEAKQSAQSQPIMLNESYTQSQINVRA